MTSRPAAILQNVEGGGSVPTQNEGRKAHFALGVLGIVKNENEKKHTVAALLVDLKAAAMLGNFKGGGSVPSKNKAKSAHPKLVPLQPTLDSNTPNWAPNAT